MSLPKFKTVRAKFLFALLLTTLVAVLVALCSMVAFDLQRFHERWIADMDAQAEILGQTTAPALEFDDPKTATENLALLTLQPQILSAAIYTARGTLYASYSSSAGGTQAPRLAGSDGFVVQDNAVSIFKPVLKNGEILGKVYMRAVYPLYERLLSYIGIAAVATGIAMAIAYFMSAQMHRMVTSPILAIGAVAREVELKRDYSLRAVKTSDDEVGHLVESFNQMLAEIEARANENQATSEALAAEVTERRRGEKEVVELNAQLEERVARRTAQLETTNQELIAAREDAEKANLAKSEFLSRMSHELRTPLNAILGFGDILVSERIASTPQQRIDFTHQILKAGRHLLALINEILDLAYVESGRLTLSIEPVSVADVLSECAAIMEPLGNQCGVRLMFPKDHGLNALVDRMRLKQIMLNLLSNAIKYNRKSGAVVVEASHVGPDRLRISVQDTGQGLSTEQAASLFQPFNRLGQENGSAEGTGIGLVLTKRLVELMEGKIGVSSTPGIGTVFWIDLPQAATTTSQVEPSPDIQTAPVDHDRVPVLLYVEDNPANLKLVQEIMGFRTDMRLVSAPDGQLGLDLAMAHLPDVVLLDMNLPGINGFEVQKKLKEDPRTSHIPVIALTANAMKREVERGMAAGFFRYLTKPINLDEFMTAIESALLESTRRQPPTIAREST